VEDVFVQDIKRKNKQQFIYITEMWIPTADFKNVWRYTSTSPHVCMALCLIKQSANFTITQK
jgi:hypothetical protein